MLSWEEPQTYNALSFPLTLKNTQQTVAQAPGLNFLKLCGSGNCSVEDASGEGWDIKLPLELGGSPGWPGTYYVDQDGFKLKSACQTPKYWD